MDRVLNLLHLLKKMVSYLEAVILGIIQGITEWLPVSSSGHLVIAEHLFGIKQPVVFDIVLQLGSLVVIIIIFWNRILKLVKGVFSGDKEQIRLFLMLLFASLPIGAVGYLFNEQIKAIFHDLRFLAAAFFFTTILLFLSRYPRLKEKNLTFGRSFFMGVMQAAAILPGVSRSGSTIATGLLLGVRKEEAAYFSFLMFIPAILGAAVYESGHLAEVVDIGVLIVGTFTSMIVGYISLKLLLRVVRTNRFYVFGWYCMLLGVLTFFLAW